MKWKKKKGISAIVGSLIFLQILLVSVVLVIYATNHQTTATERSIASLQKSTHGVIYEKYENGQTYLIVTQPIDITHIIYPNGTVKSTSISVASQINVNEILDGQPWAVITTSQGEWFNVTPITLPQIVDDALGSVWYGGGSATVGPSPNWNTLHGPPGVYYGNTTGTNGNQQYGNSKHPNSSVTVTIYNYGNSSVAVVYNISGIHHVTVWNPYWVWAVEQLETNKYQFPFSGGNQTGGYFPFNATMFDPWGQYYYYYLLVTSSLLPTINTPLQQSATYYLAPNNYWGSSEQQKPLYIIISYVVHYLVKYPDGTVKLINCPGNISLTVGNVLIINGSLGGIEFSYYYINDSIAAYVPVAANTNIYYVYYYFNNFEIYNLSALVPKQINITQFRPANNSTSILPPILPAKSTIESIWVNTTVSAPQEVPTQYLSINKHVKNDIVSITAIFDYNATAVTYNATWVHNLVLPAGPTDKYVPENVCDSALTTPLLPAPSTPEITQAYTLIYTKPPVSYTVNKYPNGSFSYSPYYLNFPATNYTGFPAYFGEYSLPAYGVTVGSPTSLYYATAWLGSLYPPTYGYIADTVLGNFSKPITSFELYITPNLYLWDAGLIRGELQQPGFVAWEPYYGVPIGDWQIVDYMPIYVVVPGGTYVENVSEGVFVS